MASSSTSKPSTTMASSSTSEPSLTMASSSSSQSSLTMASSSSSQPSLTMASSSSSQLSLTMASSSSSQSSTTTSELSLTMASSSTSKPPITKELLITMASSVASRTEVLPEDTLAFEIIPHLSIKQITQCKILSKFFLQSIESFFFNSIFRAVIPDVLCLSGLKTINLLKLNKEDKDPILKEADYPDFDNQFYICGFCKGVLLLASGEISVNSVMVFNPCSDFLQDINWGEFYDVERKFDEFKMIGLGFVGGIFKIIRLRNLPITGLREVFVFDCETEEWRNSEAVYKSQKDSLLYGFRSGCLVLRDKLCHWLLEPLTVKTDKPCIIRFDLQEDEWLTDVRLPPLFLESIRSRLSDRHQFTLSIAEQKLIVSVSCCSPLIDVWVLTDYDFWDSWSLFRINLSYFPRRLIPPVGFSVLTLGPQVLLIDRCSLILYWYDVDQQSAVEMAADSVRFVDGHINKCSFHYLPW